MTRVSRNCPARRMDLTDDAWRTRIATMLTFCVACHVGTIAFLVGRLFA